MAETPPENTEAGERCPICGTTDPADLYSLLDKGRAFDAGTSGCPDPFHDDPPSPESESQ